MADTGEGSTQDIVVTGQKKEPVHVSPGEVARTAVGIAVAPATTARHIASSAFARAAGQGGDINQRVRAVGDRANDAPDKPNSGRSTIGNAVGKADSLPIGVVTGGPFAAVVGGANDILKSRETTGGKISEGGKNIATNIADRTGPLIGTAVGAALGALDSAKTVNEMKRGIYILDKKDVPGLEHQTRVINGKTVDVYVCAVDASGHKADKPWVYVNDGVTSAGGGPRSTPQTHNPMSDPAVADFVHDVTDKATGELDTFNQTVRDDNANRTQTRETQTKRFDDEQAKLDQTYKIESFEDPEREMDPKDYKKYQEASDRITTARSEMETQTTPRSASGEIQAQVNAAYDEMDASKRAPTSSGPSAQAAATTVKAPAPAPVA